MQQAVEAHDPDSEKPGKTARLSQIIDRLNERFGTNFTQADQLFFDQIEQAALESVDLQQAAKVNTIENFGLQLRKKSPLS